MNDVQDIVMDLFKEVEDVVVMSSVVIVRCKDGDWVGNALDIQEDMPWKQATVRQSEVIDRSLFTEEEKIAERDGMAAIDAELDAISYHSQQEIREMTEYTGSQESFNDQYMGGAFDNPISFGFSC